MKKDLVTTTLEALDLRRTSDGRVSVFDLLISAGAKNPRETFKRLSEAFPHTVTKCDSVKLPRKDGKKGNLATPVTNIEGWQAILMVLPGLLGDKFRVAANELISAFRNDPAKVVGDAQPLLKKYFGDRKQPHGALIQVSQ